MISKYIRIGAVIFAMGLCLTLHAQQSETNDLRSIYEERLTELEEGNAQGHFELGMWLFESFDEKSDDLSLLKSAAKSLKIAASSSNAPPYAAKMQEAAESRYKELHTQHNPDLWKMAFSVIGGLGIFLLGMKNMSEGMQAIAGNRLRKMISAVTDNPILGVGTGCIVTCLVQSSSITTVLVVGFVNSGLMALHQAIGVIIGANIGTTITGWILVLKIGKYGLPVLGVAAIAFIFSKKDRVRYISMAILGLGMVFFGLELMKNGFKPMKGVPAFEAAFAMFVADSYFGILKCALVGCLLTFLVQSSSATLGITIGLASIGAIPFETAAALVLGENIGTTITAMLASIGATTNAKRAAYAHVMFNLFGVFWITLIFGPYMILIGKIVAAGSSGISPIGLDLANTDPLVYAAVITAGIAATHTVFNCANTLVALPFLKLFARALERMIPDKGIKETPHLTTLDVRTLESPIIAIEQSRQELRKMSDGVLKMMDWNKTLVPNNFEDMEMRNKLFHREEVLDLVQKEITEFITHILEASVPHEVMEEGHMQIRIADEYESISDYIANIAGLHCKLAKTEDKISELDAENISKLHDEVTDYLLLVGEGVETWRPEVLSKANTRGDSITAMMKDFRAAHIRNVGTSINNTAFTSAIVTDMLNAYRRIKDHALNVAEALAGEK